MEERYVEVWLDETSDPSEPLWCVSLCTDEGEIRCISTHEDQSDAISAGQAAAARRGLALVA